MRHLEALGQRAPMWRSGESGTMLRSRASGRRASRPWRTRSEASSAIQTSDRAGMASSTRSRQCWPSQSKRSMCRSRNPSTLTELALFPRCMARGLLYADGEVLIMNLVEKKLRGKKIGILAGDGFEYAELAVPKAGLVAAGAEVEVISLHEGRIRGMNLTEPTRTVHVDRVIDQATVSDYDGLLIVGGFVGPDFVRQN